MSKTILIVDDNDDLRQEIRDFLEDYDVLEAASGEGALKILQRANDVGGVILDVMMPGINGLDVLAEIKRKDPHIGVIILTGHSSKDVAIEALKAKADDYIEKPIDIPKFRQAINRMMDARNGEPELSGLDLAGKMKKIQQFIEHNCFKKTSLIDAANTVCLSPKYLSRAFKQETGYGFNDYKLKIKIGKARELLAGSGYTVDQIAGKLGYEDAGSFIRQFKKIAGCTPTEYRMKMRKKRRPSASRISHRA